MRYGTFALGIPTWLASASREKNPKYVVPSYTGRPRLVTRMS